MLVLLPTQHRRGRPGRGCGKHVQDADGGVSPATTAIKQRYRQRIVKKADRLEEHVARLRQEIQKLEQKQCDIAKGVVQKTTPWKVVADYFRVFRHGYIAPTTQRHEVSCDSPRLHPGDKADVHRRFLQDVMALNVVFNGGRGVEALLEYWGFVSLHHDELNIQLVRMEAGPEGSTIAHVHAHTTITANMFGTALLEDAHDCEKETLASKLIGQHLVVPIVPMVVWFGWDSTLDRVVSMLYEADMLTSLLNLLGSVKDVARVLNSPLDFHHCSNRQTHK
ncbi:uncharacterized protein IUM83_02500 [Phytophthora cinnamomi]|uniref:uncharacterized protein n=1 Tax=Phytophthora cinnamomi TaxID=4785 RepID=UPI0035597D33|nr:hypothetical protein IUM83_02500 [Phytophthora cinnamomi]